MNRTTMDFFRLLCLAAVMLNHATYFYEFDFQTYHKYFSEDFLAVFLRQFMRFTVPSFVILSSYGLTKKYMKEEYTPEFQALPEKNKRKIVMFLEFYGDRFLKIGLPFLFWTAVLLLANGKFIFSGPDLAVSNIKVLLDALFVHNAEGHLYFLTTILECYLLFPLFYMVDSLILWAALLIVQMAVTWPLSSTVFALASAHGMTVPPLPSSFILFWAFYSYTGVIFARREKFWMGPLERIPLSVILAAVVLVFAVILSECVYNSYRLSDPDHYNHFNRNSVVIYILLFWIALIKLNRPVDGWLNQNPARLIWTKRLVAISFSVYLFHIAFLKLLYKTGISHELIAFILSIIVTTFGSIYWLEKKITRPAWVRLLLGFPSRKI